MTDNSDSSDGSSANASEGGAAANNDSSVMIDDSNSSNNRRVTDDSSADANGVSAAANNGGSAEVDASISLGDIAINVSALDSTVSNNTTTITGLRADHSSANDIAGAFSGASGVNVSAQNVGSSALVNQNVNVQANLGSGTSSVE